MKLSEWWKNKRERWWSAIVLRLLSARVMDDLVWKHRDRLATFVERNRLTRPLVYGPRSRLHVDDTAVVNNALFNTLGGEIHVGPQAFFGHDVCLLTGTHDVHLTGEARKESGGGAGRDVVVGPGAWLASRAVVVGPAVIGANAVVGVGAVVLGDVEPGAFYAGVPARKINEIGLGEKVDGGRMTEDGRQ